MVALRNNIRDALTRFKGELERELAGRVRKVVLFGSFARGDARWDSDVDVLVVLDTMTFADQRRVLELGGDEWGRSGVFVSPTVMSQEQFDTMVAHERRLVRDIEREGIPL